MVQDLDGTLTLEKIGHLQMTGVRLEKYTKLCRRTTLQLVEMSQFCVVPKRLIFMNCPPYQ